ncbi:hypothetical protein CYCD_18290 [Tenuifilaceae bacterium CYCD]|nr:hypothetical protein CYCD_18290 [Tenuifilaceae bacterium CYCD]
MARSVYYRFFFVFIAIVFAVPVFSQQDSIDEKIAKLNGIERVKEINRYASLFFRIDPSKSYSLAQRALREAVNFPDQKALAYKNIGVLHYYKGQFDSANLYYDTSYTIFKTIGDQAGVSAILNNKGIIAMEQGRYEYALNFQMEALVLNQTIGNKVSIARSYTNIANIYNAQKNFVKALFYDKQALQLLDVQAQPVIFSDILNNIGTAYSELGINDSALIYHEQALVIRGKIKNTLGVAISLGNIGNSYANLGNSEMSIPYYDKAYAIFLEQQNVLGQVAQLNAKANALLNMGQYALCEKAYKQGLLLVSSNNLRLQKLQLLNDYIIYLRIAKRFDEAEHLRSKSVALEDSLRNESLNAKLAEIETKYQTREKEQKIIALEQERELQKTKSQKERLLWSFVIAMVVLILCIVFIYYRWKQREQKLKLEQMNMEIENRLLRSQMNPHFLFNSLNSVQRFIGENNPQQAQVFLSRFAGLIRNILDSTSQNYVTLEKEVETLNLYLMLEQQRFSNRFDYSINVDESLDPEFTEIPPMLIQPFVENAIIHGVANIKEKGRIDIIFEKADRLIRCTVVDNGNGINDAKQTGGESKMHKSVGMQVTRERLRMLNQKLNFEIKADVVDLSAIDASARGTKVTVLMPYNDFD